jgi:hypothetical protein
MFWFDDAIAPTPRAVVDSPLLEPAQAPMPPRGTEKAPTAELEAVPSGTSFDFPPNTKTLEMSLFVRPEVSEDLERYRRGEITEPEYLQSRIEVATTHLKGHVSPLRLAMLKEVIAQRLENDPSLIEARTRLLRKQPSPKKLK